MKTKNVRRDFFFPVFILQIFLSVEKLLWPLFNLKKCQSQTRKKSVFKNISSTIKIATEPAVWILGPSPLHKETRT